MNVNRKNEAAQPGQPRHYDDQLRIMHYELILYYFLDPLRQS